jgi:hypothetical protein
MLCVLVFVPVWGIGLLFGHLVERRLGWNSPRLLYPAGSAEKRFGCSAPMNWTNLGWRFPAPDGPKGGVQGTIIHSPAEPEVAILE